LLLPQIDMHLPSAHKVLEERELLPEQHLVDAGYIDAEGLEALRQAYRVDLVGPTAKDYRWQAREQNGYALAHFSIDWERQQATCPQGQTSSSWTPTWTRNQEIIPHQVWLCHLWSLSSPCSLHKDKATQPFCAPL
jgi:transposase